MENSLTQQSSTNGLTLHDKSDNRRFLKLGGFINKIRTVQGWNMLSPKEVVHLAAVWDEQLERKGVPEELFDELTNRAVDHRLAFIRRGEQAPTISIELILAMFMDCSEEINRKLSAAENNVRLESQHLEYLEDIAGDVDKVLNAIERANYFAGNGSFQTYDELLEDARAKLEKATQEEKVWTAKAELLQRPTNDR